MGRTKRLIVITASLGTLGGIGGMAVATSPVIAAQAPHTSSWAAPARPWVYYHG